MSASKLRTLIASFVLLGFACSTPLPNRTYHQTTAEWDQPFGDDARVIIFVTPKSWTTNAFVTGLKRTWVHLDSEHKAKLRTGMFVFADVSPGPHNVGFYVDNFISQALGASGRLEFDAKPGQTLFVEVDWYDAPKLIPEQEAVKVIGNMRHKFGDALPFNL